MLAMFVAAIEQELQAEANSQKRSIGIDEIDDGRSQITPADFGHGITEGTDSGQDQFFCGSDFLRVGTDFRLSPDSFNSFLNAPQVAHLVVDNCDHIGGLASKVGHARQVSVILSVPKTGRDRTRQPGSEGSSGLSTLAICPSPSNIGSKQRPNYLLDSLES